MLAHNPIDEEAEDSAELQKCLIENWSFCFQYRTAMIEKADGNVDEIVKEWPALKNSYGFYLVSEII